MLNPISLSAVDTYRKTDYVTTIAIVIVFKFQVVSFKTGKKSNLINIGIIDDTMKQPLSLSIWGQQARDLRFKMVSGSIILITDAMVSRDNNGITSLKGGIVTVLRDNDVGCHSPGVCAATSRLRSYSENCSLFQHLQRHLQENSSRSTAVDSFTVALNYRYFDMKLYFKLDNLNRLRSELSESAQQRGRIFSIIAYDSIVLRSDQKAKLHFHSVESAQSFLRAVEDGVERGGCSSSACGTANDGAAICIVVARLSIGNTYQDKITILTTTARSYFRSANSSGQLIIAQSQRHLEAKALNGAGADEDFKKKRIELVNFPEHQEQRHRSGQANEVALHIANNDDDEAALRVSWGYVHEMFTDPKATRDMEGRVLYLRCSLVDISFGDFSLRNSGFDIRKILLVYPAPHVGDTKMHQDEASGGEPDVPSHKKQKRRGEIEGQVPQLSYHSARFTLGPPRCTCRDKPVPPAASGFKKFPAPCPLSSASCIAVASNASSSSSSPSFMATRSTQADIQPLIVTADSRALTTVFGNIPPTLAALSLLTATSLSPIATMSTQQPISPLLPPQTMDYAAACSEIAEGLRESALAGDEFTFTLRLCLLVDENGFLIVDEDHILSLEAISA